MNRLEILAPAGGPESLEPAVRCGADAVYLGAARFSARGAAQNFDREELAAAVEYCHARGVKVYLALNTLLRDDELAEALQLAEYACRLPVDALIVQDLGLSRVLARCAPGLKRSASTQMSIHTPQGAALCRELGFGRVVLARECSAAEIAEIARTAELELECFAHGALCMSVSGQCWFSAVLGSRSGNRGLCAQPCRLPFAAPGGTGHDLSLKDLSLAGRLGELAGLGVTSAKIEGRMKRPEYVAAAVSACRRDADGEPVPPWLAEDLQAVFSRSGFTQGYFDGARGREMFGTRRREDVEAAPAALKRLHGLYRAERQSIPVRLAFSAQTGQACRLTMEDPDGNRVCISGAVPQPAQNAALSQERCAVQLTKLGGTPFAAQSCVCTLDEGLALPAAELNRVRREAAEELLALRAKRPPVVFSAQAAEQLLAAPVTHGSAGERTGENAALRLHFAAAEQIPAGEAAAEKLRRAELVYLRAGTPPQELEKLQQQGLHLGVELPRALFGCTEAFRAHLRTARSLGISDVWAGTLNAAALAREEGLAVHGGFGLNAFNTQSLELLRELGLRDTEVSIELTLTQIAALGGELPRGVTVYGRLPLMLTRCCPLQNGRSCAHCDKNGSLTDRRGASFPVRCFGGASELLNSVPLFLLDRLREVRGIDFISMRFTVENSVEIGEILTHFPKNSRPEYDFTRGLAEKGVI
ncbi:MAG: U32 family peptidase [Firmicutes bacterium]|nr:U32 family peptidase [Bacillota bacterium]